MRALRREILENSYPTLGEFRNLPGKFVKNGIVGICGLDCDFIELLGEEGERG